MFCVWAGSHGFHFAFGLTRISQIPQYRFVGGKSHRCFCVWAVGLARIPLCFWAHTDLTDPTVLLCGWKISQMLLRVGWLARIPLCFWAHTDLTLLLGSHRSHRSHSIALWVGNLTDVSACGPWGCTGLALTDLFFGPFGPIRPIGPIGQIGHF